MFLLCAAFGVATYAADIIVLKNNTRIDAKIIEVSSNAIKYKMADNPDGPVFVQDTYEIATVIYENGKVTTYNQAAPAAAPAAAAAPAQQPKQAKAERQPVQEPAEEAPADGKKIKFNPTPSDKYAVGLTLGYVSKNIKYSEDGHVEKGSYLCHEENKTTPALRFGMTINPTFKYGIGIRTGAFLEYGHEKDGEVHYHDINVSIPAQLSYRYELIKKLSFMIYTGPVFDFGSYMIASYEGEKTENMYTEDKYQGFNALWGIGAGIQWSRLRFDIGGEFGMTNKKKFYGVSDSDVAIKWNKPVYITLTCML